MNNENAYFLTTERLAFRCWTPRDEDLARELWGDPLVTRFLVLGKLSEEEVKERLYDELECQVEFGVQFWPLFNLDSGMYIGCAGLRPFDEEGGVYELGVFLKPSEWKKGYAEEAANAIITFAFSQLKVNGLVMGHHPENTATRSLIRKLGFQYIGTVFFKETKQEHLSYLLPRLT